MYIFRDGLAQNLLSKSLEFDSWWIISFLTKTARTRIRPRECTSINYAWIGEDDLRRWRKIWYDMIGAVSGWYSSVFVFVWLQFSADWTSTVWGCQLEGGNTIFPCMAKRSALLWGVVLFHVWLRYYLSLPNVCESIKPVGWGCPLQ